MPKLAKRKNKSREFDMTHQARPYLALSRVLSSVLVCFCFPDGHLMWNYGPHIGRGLVGQLMEGKFSSKFDNNLHFQTYSWKYRPSKFLIDPLGRPTDTTGSDHCFCTCSPFVPTFQNKINFKRKRCLLLARLCVWPRRSLMTQVLSHIIFSYVYRLVRPNIFCASQKIWLN